MKKTFIVIGLGRFGKMVVKTLKSLKADVLAVDIDADKVNEIQSICPNCVVADTTKESVLKELQGAKFSHAIVAIGNNLQASILTVLNLQQIGIEKITVRADEEMHKQVFERLGCTDVIVPEESSATAIANQALSDTMLDYYEIAEDYSMAKITVGKEFKAQENKSLIELDVRNKFDINIVGIIKGNNEFIIPKGTDSLRVGDTVAVVGTRKAIVKFDKFLN